MTTIAKNNKLIIDKNTFSSIWFLIYRIFLKSLFLWIILSYLLLVVLLDFSVTIMQYEHDIELTNYGTEVVLSLMPSIIIGLVVSPYIFSQISRSSFSTRIGSSKINSLSYILTYWFIFLVISLLSWFIFYFVFELTVLIYVEDSYSFLAFQQVIQTLVFGIVLIVLINALGLFIASLNISAIVKMIIAIFLIVMMTKINYFPKVDVGYLMQGPIWVIIIWWFFIVINPITIPLSLIMHMSVDITVFEWYIYIAFVIIMILQSLFLLYLSNKIFSLQTK